MGLDSDWSFSWLEILLRIDNFLTELIILGSLVAESSELSSDSRGEHFDLGLLWKSEDFLKILSSESEFSDFGLFVSVHIFEFINFIFYLIFSFLKKLIKIIMRVILRL